VSHCKTVFNQEQGKELVIYVFVMENRFFVLTLSEMRGLDFDLAERNGICDYFNKAKKMAG
jgi:hypothetical protein